MFEGRHVAVEQLAVLGAVRLGHQVLVGRHLVEPGTRALEGAFDGRRGGAEQGGDLGRPPGQHVAQDEHGPLPGRQILQRGDERKPQAAPRRHDGRWVDKRVGQWLQPRDVRRRGPQRLLRRA